MKNIYASLLGVMLTTTSAVVASTANTAPNEPKASAATTLKICMNLLQKEELSHSRAGMGFSL